jgi:hypothetical protein
MLKPIGRLLVVLAFGWAASANAGLMLNITSPGDVAPCGNGCTPAGSTYGWAFNVNSTITIDGLGIWDFDADGIGPDVSMGLWVDGGALLASAVISNSSALQFTNGAGGWRFEDIAELLLAPGNYVIGAANYPTSPTAYVNPGFSTIAEVTYTGNRAVFLSQGLVRPDGPLFIDLDIIGPNLRVTENAEIPAPATLPLLGLGLAALGYIRRRRITS